MTTESPSGAFFRRKASLNPDILLLLSRNNGLKLGIAQECRLTMQIDFYTLASRIGAPARREGNCPSLAQAALDLMQQGTVQMKWRLHATRRARRMKVEGWRCAFGVLAVALLAGCATKGPGLTADSPPEVKAAAVRERANARWAELIKGDKDAAYAYLSPGVRKMVSPEQYSVRVKTGGFRAVKIDRVDCEAEICTVRLQLTYDYRAEKGVGSVKGITTMVQETWVVEQGQAWFVMRP